jgi:hypothetical protein
MEGCIRQENQCEGGNQAGDNPRDGSDHPRRLFAKHKAAPVPLGSQRTGAGSSVRIVKRNPAEAGLVGRGDMLGLIDWRRKQLSILVDCGKAVPVIEL